MTAKERQLADTIVGGDHKYGRTGLRDENLAFRSNALDGRPGRFHFIHFQTQRMMGAFKMVHSVRGHEHVRHLYVAGGGASKYGALAQEELGIEFIPMDEIATIVKAVAFVAKHVPHEIFSLDNVSFRSDKGGGETSFQRIPRPVTPDQPLFPFLLCNIGKQCRDYDRDRMRDCVEQQEEHADRNNMQKKMDPK